MIVSPNPPCDYDETGFIVFAEKQHKKINIK